MSNTITSVAHLDSSTIRSLRSVYLRTWVLSLGIVALEILGAALSGSLALLADIGHVLMDTGLALIPLSVLFIGSTRLNYDLMIRVAGVLATLMLALIGGHVVSEAYEGLHGNHHHHEVNGWILFVFSGLAGTANILQHRLLSQVSPLHRHAAHSGLHFHVLADLTKNIVLPMLGLLIAFHWIPDHADLWVALLIGIAILIRAALLGFETLVRR